MVVVLGEVVGDAGDARVHVGAAQLLGADLLAGRGLDQGRPAQEDRALLLDDDRLVGHRRHVGAARGARAHDHRDLRDAGGRHGRLVVEDPPEVVAIGEHLVLVGQIGAARIDQIDARQPVLPGDVLGAQVLLHRDRVVGAALDRGVVGDDHALAAHDPADAGDDAGARHLVVVHAVRGELRQLQERRAGVEQPAHALARQQLAARQVALARPLVAALLDPLHHRVQVVDQRAHRGGVRLERRRTGIDRAGDDAHGFESQWKLRAALAVTWWRVKSSPVVLLA